MSDSPHSATKLAWPEVRPATLEAFALCRRCRRRTEITEQGSRAVPWGDLLCRGCLEQREEARREKREARAEELLRECGIMPEHADATLMDFDPVIAAEVSKYSSPPRFGFMLNGLYGRGKTRLAAAIARESIIAGESVLFGMSRQILRRIRCTFGPGAIESESSVIHELCTVGLLVIDDLGPDREGRPSEHVLGTLHEVLSERIGHQRATVITTNLPTSGIEEIYGGAIASRLSKLHRITLTGPDLRRGGN